MFNQISGIGIKGESGRFNLVGIDLNCLIVEIILNIS